MTPAEAAARLGTDPKRVRRWLRANRPGPVGGRWVIDESTFDAMASSLVPGADRSARTTGTTGRRVGPRAGSDEHYVLDLCDAVLGEAGLRQHSFAWLLGDPGPNGRRAHLRVDAYYPHVGVVVEYRERQHHEPVPHFDKPDRITISGVHRGEQRRRYDERRDVQIPAHGLVLWVIEPADVAADHAGRLKHRDPVRDRALIARSWEQIGGVP